jgi:hypothetical protein
MAHVNSVSVCEMSRDIVCSRRPQRGFQGPTIALKLGRTIDEIEGRRPILLNLGAKRGRDTWDTKRDPRFEGVAGCLPRGFRSDGLLNDRARPSQAEALAVRVDRVTDNGQAGAVLGRHDPGWTTAHEGHEQECRCDQPSRCQIDFASLSVGECHVSTPRGSHGSRLCGELPLLDRGRSADAKKP